MTQLKDRQGSYNKYLHWAAAHKKAKMALLPVRLKHRS
jgi:hypothetical protein